MDIRSLRSFLMIAQCLSFTEAAKRIYIGQSALSKQIAELEEELGVELFIRHYRSLELTPAGKALLREGNALINKVADVIEKTRQAHLGMRGSLRIGCFGCESAFLPRAIKRFHSLYPQISIDIRVLTLKMIEDALELKELDLGFIVQLGNELKSDKFIQRLIHRTPICFLLPSNHPYANESSIDISSLSQDSFVVLLEAESQQGFAWFLDFCKIRGFILKIVNKTTQMGSIYWLVEAGVGISFTAKDPVILRDISPNISLVDMQGEDAYFNVMATWKKENNNPAVPLFLKVLEAVKLQKDTSLDLESSYSK